MTTKTVVYLDKKISCQPGLDRIHWGGMILEKSLPGVYCRSGAIPEPAFKYTSDNYRPGQLVLAGLLMGWYVGKGLSSWFDFGCLWIL
jgi:hypothetical protein